MKYTLYRAGEKPEYYNRGGIWYTSRRELAEAFNTLNIQHGIMSYVKEYTVDINKPFTIPISPRLNEGYETFLAYYYVYNGLEPDNSKKDNHWDAVNSNSGKEYATIAYMENEQGITEYESYADLSFIADVEGRWDEIYAYAERHISEELKQSGYDSVVFLNKNTGKPLEVFVFT